MRPKWFGAALLLVAACAGSRSHQRVATQASAVIPPLSAVVPAPPPPTPVAPSLDEHARFLVDALARHDFDAAVKRFDSELAQGVSSADLAELWRKVEDAAGAFQGIEGIEVDTGGDDRIVRIVCRFAHLRKVLRLIFGKDDAIGGLFFGPVPKEAEDAALRLVDKLSRQDFQAVVLGFDTMMKGTLPAPKLGDVWKQVVRRKGSFAEVTDVRFVPSGGLWSVLLTCRFQSGSLVVKVVYDLRDQVAGLFFLPGDALAAWRPPAYAHPARFVERDILVGTTPPLPGTLSIPKGSPPFPTAILVHGSGPTDADSSLGPNKIFKDLAFGLASRGIAVLRYEKRTHRLPTAVASIREEVLDDATAAIDLARHTPELDPRRLGLVGHSQGGYLAPRIAADSGQIAALVLLAAPSRPLQDSMLDQLTYLLKLDPQSTERKLEVLAAKAFKTRVEDPALKPDESVNIPTGGVEKAAYFLSLRGYRPTDVAKSLSIPILVLQGSRDYQVTAPDLDGWKKALQGKPGTEFRTYAALNHLFTPGTGTPRPSEYEVAGHVDEAVIADIAAFLARVPGLPTP